MRIYYRQKISVCLRKFSSLKSVSKAFYPFAVGVGYSVGLLIFESVCCMIFFSCKFYIINRLFYLLYGCLTVNFWDTIKGTACTPKKQKIHNISVRLKIFEVCFFSIARWQKGLFQPYFNWNVGLVDLFKQKV